MRDGAHKSGGNKSGIFSGVVSKLWKDADSYNNSERDQHSRTVTTGKKNIAVTAIGRRGHKSVGKR